MFNILLNKSAIHNLQGAFCRIQTLLQT